MRRGVRASLILFGALAGCRLGVPPGAALPDEFARRVEQVRLRVEAARGRSFVHMPPIERIPPERRCCVVDSISQSAWVASLGLDTNAAMDRMMQAAGLLKPRTSNDLQQARLDCMATRAMYLMASKSILLFEDSVPGNEESALAHEMVHALQDEQINIAKVTRRRHETDEVLGLLGALEGVAELVSDEATGAAKRPCEPEPPAALWQLHEAIRNVPMFRSLPPAVILPTYGPYVHGRNLACVLEGRYGKAGLDTLLLRPPRGTWQLWHARSYLADQAPVDWDTAWSGFGPLPAGWRPLGQMRTGEARLAGLPLTWDRVGAKVLLDGDGLGWAGDRLWAFAREGADVAIVWRIAFVDRSHALRFARVWWKTRGIRAEVRLPAWSDWRGRASWSLPRKTSWQIRVIDDEVVVADGFDEATGQRLLESVRARPVRSEAPAGSLPDGRPEGGAGN